MSDEPERPPIHPDPKMAVRVLKQGPESWARFEGKNAECDLMLLSDEDLSDLQMAEPAVIFKKSTLFQNCHFSGWPFGKVAFQADVSFEKCTFAGIAELYLGVSHNRVSFYRTRFEDALIVAHTAGGLLLDSCEFAQSLAFEGTQSERITIGGSDTLFYGLLKADGVHFAGGLSLANFTLSSKVKSVSWLGGASFRGATFSKSVDIKNVRFTGDVKFDEAIFKAPARFRGTIFGRAPSFYDAKLNPETVFDPVENFDRQFPDTTTISAEKRYQTLKELFGKQQALSEQLGFARLEMKSHARTSYFNMQKIYGWFGDYGLAWRLPLLWLLATNAAFFAIFISMASSDMASARHDVLIYGLSNVFPFVGGLKALASDLNAAGTLPLFPAGLKIWVALLSVVQNILSSVFLFLIALAVRNRLRMK